MDYHSTVNELDYLGVRRMFSVDMEISSVHEAHAYETTSVSAIVLTNTVNSSTTDAGMTFDGLVASSWLLNSSLLATITSDFGHFAPFSQLQTDNFTMNDGTYIDLGDNFTFQVTPSMAKEVSHHLKFWALILLVFPVITLFGNTLVVVSVYRERALRTATNYFIVSLAIADLMVAVLVMPPGIFVEVNNQSWTLGDGLCDTWVAFDVFCSTASILNLVAISIDRFIAVTQPIKYAKHKSSRRVYIMIAICWLVSAVICSPIPLVNYTAKRADTPDLCIFYNSDFLIYSSMGSFYIPCLIMTYLYWRIFHAIWARARHMAVARQGTTSSMATASIKDSAKTINEDRRTVVAPTIGMTTQSAVSKETLKSGHRSTRKQHQQKHQQQQQPHLIHRQQPSIKVTSTDASEVEVFSPCRIPLSGGSSAAYTRLVSDSSTIVSMPAASDTTTTTTNGDDNNVELATLLRYDVGDGGSDSAESVGMRISPLNTPQRTMGFVPSNYERGVTTSDEGGIMSPPAAKENGSCKEAIEMETLEDDSDEVAEMATISKLVVLMAPTDHISRARQRIQNILSSRRKTGRVSSRKEKKATKTLAIVLVIFLMCWVPFFTINIINAVCIRYNLQDKRPECSLSPILFSCFVWLGYINSALNPVIYTIFNLDFRRAFKNILFSSTC